jgi:hypothetical protein
MTFGSREPAPPATTLPRRRSTVAMRFDGGRDAVAQVVDGDGDYIRVAPAPAARVDSLVDLVWGSGGTYQRAGARVIESTGGGLWLALGAVAPIERRYFQRVAPPRPLRAELRVLNRSGAAVERVTGSVHDLSVGGLGVLITAPIKEGATVEVSVLEQDGRVVLTAIRGEIVRVTSDPRGQIAGARFDAVWECVHALRDLLDSGARA